MINLDSVLKRRDITLPMKVELVKALVFPIVIYARDCAVVLYLVTQSHLTLCDPMEGILPGFSVPGILQARRLEWVAISSFRGSSPPRD